jgi:hypothetical protein
MPVSMLASNPQTYAWANVVPVFMVRLRSLRWDGNELCEIGEWDGCYNNFTLAQSASQKVGGIQRSFKKAGRVISKYLSTEGLTALLSLLTNKRVQ